MVQLLDDFGTISMNITTASDFNKEKNSEKFRVPYVTNHDNFPNQKVSKKLSNFIEFNNSPFYYRIIAESFPDHVLY